MKGTGNDNDLLPIVLISHQHSLPLPLANPFLAAWFCVGTAVLRAPSKCRALASDKPAKTETARPNNSLSFSHCRVRITPPRCIYDSGPTRTLQPAATVRTASLFSSTHTIATAGGALDHQAVISSLRRQHQEKLPLRPMPAEVRVRVCRECNAVPATYALIAPMWATAQSQPRVRRRVGAA